MNVGTDRVGIRELRRNLSAYLDRVRAGQALEVTDRGRPVAILAPLRRPESPVARLVAAARATQPVGRLLDLPAPAGRATTRLSEAVLRDREDRM